MVWPSVTSGTDNHGCWNIKITLSILREIKEEANAIAEYTILDTICYTESVLLGDHMDFFSNVAAPDWILGMPSLRKLICRFTVPWNFIQK